MTSVWVTFVRAGRKTLCRWGQEARFQHLILDPPFDSAVYAGRWTTSLGSTCLPCSGARCRWAPRARGGCRAPHCACCASARRRWRPLCLGSTSQSAHQWCCRGGRRCRWAAGSREGLGGIAFRALGWWGTGHCAKKNQRQCRTAPRSCESVLRRRPLSLPPSPITCPDPPSALHRRGWRRWTAPRRPSRGSQRRSRQLRWRGASRRPAGQ